MLALTVPLLSLTQELTDITTNTPIFTQAEGENQLMGEIGREMSVQIGNMIANRFAIPRDDIQVKLTVDLADLSAISLVKVDLLIDCNCDRQAIEEYLSNALGCPVEVMVVQNGP